MPNYYLETNRFGHTTVRRTESPANVAGARGRSPTRRRRRRVEDGSISPPPSPPPVRARDEGGRTGLIMERALGGIVFTLEKRRDRRVRRFNATRYYFALRFRRDNRAGGGGGPLLLRDCLETLTQALDTVIEIMRTNNPRPETDVQLSLMSDELDRAINMPLLPLHGNRPGDELMFALSRVIQSKERLTLDATLEITAAAVGYVDRPRTLQPLGASRYGERFDLGPHSTKRFLHFLPDLSGEALGDCCALVGVVYAMAYNREMAVVGNRAVRNPLSGLWKALRYVTLVNARDPRASRAKSRLARLVREQCAEKGLAPRDFRLADPDSLARLADSMNVNLAVYSHEMGCQCEFRHPSEFDPRRQRVCLLAVEGDAGSRHCGVILRIDRFLAQRGRIDCDFCGRVFSTDYVRFHRCPKRRGCDMCRRPLAFPTDWIDRSVLDTRCVRGNVIPSGSPCPACSRRSYSDACLRHHRRRCAKHARCGACGAVYRKNGKFRHRCGEFFCRTCRKFKVTADGRHECEIVRPGRPATWQRMAVFDFETVCEETNDFRHAVNAVGVSYEKEFGRFFEVCYYDDEMRNDKDGVEDERPAWEFRYWPEGERNPVARKTPKKLKPAFQPCVYEGGRRRRAGASARSFLDGEAAEADGGEEEEDRGDDDDDGDADLPPGAALRKFAERFMTEEFYDYVFIAHNFSRFDGLLLLNYLVRRKKFLVEPIFEGQKLLHLKIPSLRITFVDSYRYIRMRLANFPRRFPALLEDDSVKGVFPYRFNRPENYQYDGDVPAEEEFFDPEFAPEWQMREAREFRSLFRGRWRFAEQMDTYLRADVRVLRGGCCHQLREYFDFQRDLLGRAGGDRDSPAPPDGGVAAAPPLLFHCFSRPFFTASSFAHAVFRHFNLEDGQLFLLENQTNARKSSKYELEWLAYEARSGRRIRTSFNDSRGQKKIGKYFVDGYEEATRTVFEFYGCVVHGHVVPNPACPLSRGMSAESLNPFNKRIEDAYSYTRRRAACIVNSGYSLIEKWECEYVADRGGGDAGLVRFLETEYYAPGSRPPERLALRRALRGGRTEAFRLLFRAAEEPGRRMFYVDKNSLYPHVAIEHSYPVGKPAVYLDEKLTDVEVTVDRGFRRLSDGVSFIGVAQVTILPPDSIFVPFLPVTVGGKMKYGLCAECLRTENADFCRHSDAERALLDTWTTVEIVEAVRRGYRIVKVHEIVGYDRAATIFRRHYLGLARMKLAAEGFPDGAPSDREKAAHVNDLNSRMPGLGLEARDVRRNPARRQFAKDLSNTGLGKLSQNESKTVSEYVYNGYRLYELKNSSATSLKRINFISGRVVEAVSEPRRERAGYARNTQSLVYAFVTAYARLAMYRDIETLHRLGARLFYMDTDSLIFDIADDFDRGRLERALGLGSLAYGAYKYETGSPIASFVSCGPKNYSFVTEDGVECVKIRGFSLTNPRILTSLNNASLTELLRSWLRGETRRVETRNAGMKIDRKRMSVRNSVVKKVYRNDTYDKRWVPEDEIARGVNVATYPYGVKSAEFADLNF